MVPRISTEEEVRGFYERWKSPVFTYCLLYLGDESLAEDATEEAFVRFFEQSSTKFWSDGSQMPLRLLQATLIASQKRCSIRNKTVRLGNSMQDVIPFLPCEERMVFVLHSVLDVPYSVIAAATGFDQITATGYWSQAMLRIRELLKEKVA